MLGQEPANAPNLQIQTRAIYKTEREEMASCVVTLQIILIVSNSLIRILSLIDTKVMVATRYNNKFGSKWSLSWDGQHLCVKNNPNSVSIVSLGRKASFCFCGILSITHVKKQGLKMTRSVIDSWNCNFLWGNNVMAWKIKVHHLVHHLFQFGPGTQLFPLEK